MKNKKWLLLLLLAFPSLFWLILETSTINSRKLPHYGPKKAITKDDTLYYAVPRNFYPYTSKPAAALETLAYPVYGIVFVHPKYRNDVYRLTGLWEYANYKKDKIEHIPFIIVCPADSGKSPEAEELIKLSENKNLHFYTWPRASYDSLIKVYFKEKPYYIDYSFFQLIDATNSVRGYYDARYVSEMKRFIDEYRHLRLKEEKKLLIEENEIKKVQ